MKRNALLLLACCSLSLGAQLKRGNFLIGISGNYNQRAHSDTDTSSTLLQSLSENHYSGLIRLGYFVTDQFVFGLMGGVGGSAWRIEQTYPGMSTTQSKSRGVNKSFGMFGRFYKSFAEGRFALFGHCDVTRSFGENITETEVFQEFQMTTHTSSHGFRTTNLGLAIAPGITWFITPHFAIEAQIGQIGANISEQWEYGSEHLLISHRRSNDFGAVFNPTTFLMGISFYVGEKKKSD